MDEKKSELLEHTEDPKIIGCQEKEDYDST
jgi:hypothetical protein